jgi:hypothetical protein
MKRLMAALATAVLMVALTVARRRPGTIGGHADGSNRVGMPSPAILEPFGVEVGVCHKPGGHQLVMNLPIKAILNHLKHGDLLYGDHDLNPETPDICFNPGL